jgi:hypothetical protein
MGSLERAMRDDDWRDAGAGWQGKHGEILLMGWSPQRRVVLLRRRLAGVMITQREGDGQLALGFVEIDQARQEAWEYAVLVTSLTFRTSAGSTGNHPLPSINRPGPTDHPACRPWFLAKPGASERVSYAPSQATGRSGRTPKRGAGNLSNLLVAYRSSLDGSPV